MEDTRFDAIARALGSLTTRRLTLGALLGGALGHLGLADAEAKSSSRKCKPKCDECEKCKKGKKGKKGKCKLKADGAPCTTFPGGACQNGTCIDLQADEANCGAFGTVCGPTQVCQAGSCFPKSTCPATAPHFCSGSGISCGSPNCNCTQSTEGNLVCLSLFGAQCPPPTGSGTACTTSASCPPGSACMSVSGGICTCAAGTKICVPECPTPDA